MNTTLKRAIATIAIGAFTITSCKKEKEEPVAVALPGNMKIQFEYVFGSNMLPWETGKTMVHPKTGDSLTFTTLKMYVSNIKLKKADGTWWTQPESYFLTDASVAGGSTLTITDIPAGNYTAMEYTMGVDSTRNVSGANTGALSLSNGMFWDWNTGYIMLKAEGKSPQAANGGFNFHLGGFSGENNIVTTKSTDFGSQSISIERSKTPTIKLVANPARLWHNSPSLSVRSVIHMPGTEARQMAKDFYDNISFSAVE